MNTAAGMETMAATANVVTEMVTQRRTMRDGMMKTQEGMMPLEGERIRDSRSS